MTRKDFELIARTIKHSDLHAVSYQEAKSYMAKLFADALAGTNANFDRARFLKACGHAE